MELEKFEDRMLDVIKDLTQMVKFCVERVVVIEERLDGGDPAKVDRRTEAQGSGSRVAQDHLMIVK